MTAFFSFGIAFYNFFLFGSTCICVWAWIIGCVAGTRGLYSPGVGLSSAHGLIYPIFY